MEQKEGVYLNKSNRSQITLIVFVIVAAVVIFIYWLCPKTRDVSVAEKEKSLAQAEEVIQLLNEDQYDKITDLMDAKLQSALSPSELQKAKQKLCADYGTFDKYGKTYVSKLEQRSKRYYVVQETVVYSKTTVTYTITFDSKMKLAGLYMK